MHMHCRILLSQLCLAFGVVAVSGCGRDSAPAPAQNASHAADRSDEAHAPPPTPASATVATAVVEDSAHAADDHAHHTVADTAAAPAGGWPSDAPLRQGMQAILEAVLAAMDAESEGPALAATLRAQIDFMFANCRLEPAADAALHGILAELMQSALRLEAGASVRDEHAALHAAMQRYGQQFQHPDWPLH